MSQTEIPICQKYTLSIKEAAEYFRIGQGRLRQIAADNPNADYIRKMEIGCRLSGSNLRSILILQRQSKKIFILW